MTVRASRRKEGAFLERIPQQIFESRTGIGWMDPTIEYVISLRDMDPQSISEIRVMERSTLQKLLSGIVLEGDAGVHPYAECSFNIMQVDPNDLQVGQTFVQRNKYQFLLEKFSGILGNGFCTDTSLAQCGPLIVYGADTEDRPCVALYLPPIVELAREQRFLIDGVHRNFIVRAVGGAMKAIVIQGVRTPLPCDPIPWSHISVVTDKPARQERFRNLRRAYFRNTKFAGIDG